MSSDFVHVAQQVARIPQLPLLASALVLHLLCQERHRLVPLRERVVGGVRARQRRRRVHVGHEGFCFVKKEKLR